MATGRMLQKRIKREHIPTHIRKAVIVRDNYTCQYCGKVGVYAYCHGVPTVFEPKKPDHTIKTETGYNGEPYYDGTNAISFEIDHINPVVSGGNSLIDNLILSCRSCNRKKGSKNG